VVNQGKDFDLDTKREPPPSDTRGNGFAYMTDDERVAFLLLTLAVIERKVTTKTKKPGRKRC
jgi:hypothetical protein